MIHGLKDFFVDPAGKVQYTDDLAVDHAALQEIATRFYETLHRKRATDTWAQDQLLSRMEEVEPNLADSASGMVGIKEVAQAVRDSDNGKTPGLDGLPMEFYKMFWKKIGNDLTDAYNAAVCKHTAQGGHGMHHMWEGVITLLHKKGDT